MKQSSEITGKALSQIGSQTQVGHTELPEQTVVLVNEVFELFALNYSFWNYQLEADQVSAKKKLWGEAISRYSPERVRDTAMLLIKTYGQPGGPPLEIFLVNAKRDPAHKTIPASQQIDYDRDRSVGLAELEKMRQIVGD